MGNCSENNYPIVVFSRATILSVNFVYVLTSLLSLFGNLIVIKVYSNHKYLNKLKAFLINLAVADILNGVLCIPFTYTELLYGRWVLPGMMCPIAQFAQYLCVYISAITLTAISVERFIAILNPFSKLNAYLISHSNLILVIIWMSGISYSSIGTEATEAIAVIWMNRTFYSCQQHINQNPNFAKIFSLTNFSLTYAVPLIIMTILYTILVRKLVKITDSPQISLSENKFNFGTDFQLRRNSITCAKTKCVKLLIIVVISFMICMTPTKVRQLIHWFNPKIFSKLFCSKPKVLIWMKLTFNWLSTVHSVANPIIYSFLSENFRRQLGLDYRKLKNKIKKICH